MTNPKESGAWIEVGPHNMIGVALEDLPKAERRVLEKELEEEMVEARRGGRSSRVSKRHAHG
jgi:hypothetical protein